jgi:hypothetical protein
MIDITAIKATAPDLLTLAENLTTLRKSSSTEGGEWSGPCPFCGGRDRFSVQPYHKPEARWLCRHCTDGKWKDVITFVERRDKSSFMDACRALFGPMVQITPEESARLLAERTARQEEERRREQEAQAARRAELDESGAALRYWENLSQYPEAREMWEKRGLSRMWQDYFRVGYSPSREFWHDNKVFTSPSLTIPTWRGFHLADSTALDEPNKDDPGGTNNSCRCVGLVHRLLIPDAPGGKYRPHLSGVGKPLFNCDIYAPEILGDVLLIEGEVKSMVTWAFIQDTHPTPSYLRRITVVGIAGMKFKPDWIPEFDSAGWIWICLDPDARQSADGIAASLGPERCRIIDLPGKIDDLLVDGTLQVSDLPGLLKTARAVQSARMEK